MKGLVAALTMALAIFALTGLARAADSPVILSHQVTGYEKGQQSVSISYTIQVVNPGTASLSDLTLTVIPSHVRATDTTTLAVGALPAKQAREMSLQLKGIPAIPKDYLSREPLFLSGKCIDGDGRVLEFPVTSYPGGAR